MYSDYHLVCMYTKPCLTKLWFRVMLVIKNLFVLHKHAIISNMGNIDIRTNCQPLFKMEGLLTLSALYIIRNVHVIQTNSNVHNYITRNCNSLKFITVQS